MSVHWGVMGAAVMQTGKRKRFLPLKKGGAADAPPRTEIKRRIDQSSLFFCFCLGVFFFRAGFVLAHEMRTVSDYNIPYSLRDYIEGIQDFFQT